MCYSLAGRVQTRLAALVVPFLLTAVLVRTLGDERYLTMFLVMTVVALDLDIAVYDRMIGYQARWQMYLLGVVEFVAIWAVVRFLAGTLPFRSIVGFYLISWVGGLLVVNVVLPVLDPLWVEHGGELWRPAIPRRAGDSHAQSVLAAGRRWLVGEPGTALAASSLALFVVLQLTVIPTALTASDVVFGLAGALAVELLASRIAGVWPDLVADVLTGLTVVLLVRAENPAAFAVATGVAAAARIFLRLGGRELVNPVALALLPSILFIPGVYSAEGEWGNSLLLPLIVANVGLLVALRRSTAPAFLAFVGILLLHGLNSPDVAIESPHQWLQVWLPETLPASLLFFAGFVLVSPFGEVYNWQWQVVMGALIAASGLLFQHLGLGLAFPVATVLWTYLFCTTVALNKHLFGTTSPESEAAKSPLFGHPISRRSFLGAAAITTAAVAIGGSVRRLTGLDPAILSLPPDPVLAGGQAIPRFRNIASGAGIILSHHADPNVGSPAIGTGVAWGDYDLDGRIDLYVTDQMGASHLYHNNGDGTFTDVAARAGVARPGQRATSATFVDYDNDGYPDLYVGVAGGPNRLYHNSGNGTFSDVTERSGLGEQLGRTMASAWADYDGDGYLDVFVANYPDEPISFEGNISIIEDVRTVKHMARPHNRLYHNNGDGTFTDVTHLLGDIAMPATRGFGFSAVWLDFNNDGRPDLYVAYDFGSDVTPNVLWRNDGPDGQGGWRFTQVEREMGVATAANTMGVASGDYDNDGWMDLAVSNIGPNWLYRNGHGRGFQNVAERAGVSHSKDTVDNMLNPSMTWGIDLADFNNDGWLDLFLVAGAMDFENIPQPNAMYLNDHTGRFIDVSAASGTNDPGQGRSVAVGDFDGDGYLDMFVANYGQPPLLYHNLSRTSGNHWIRLELEGTLCNRDAVGARAILRAPGLPPQLREVQIGQGLGSCDAKALHFGIGLATGVERIDIMWPGGQRQTLFDLKANRVYRIKQPGQSRWPRRA